MGREPPVVPTISILLLFSMDSSSEAGSAKTRFGVCGAGRVVFTASGGEGRVGCLRPDWILSRHGRRIEVIVLETPYSQDNTVEGRRDTGSSLGTTATGKRGACIEGVRVAPDYSRGVAGRGRLEGVARIVAVCRESIVRAMGYLLDGSGPELLTSSSQDGQAGGVIWFSRKKDWNR
jgi:hypothetical protein